MPDAPKNSADDEAMLEALNRWTGFPRGEIKRGFMAGWRAAMAEVKKERDHLDQIACAMSGPRTCVGTGGTCDGASVHERGRG